MNTPNLYTPMQEFNALERMLEELGGEVTPEIEEYLSITKENMQEKSAIIIKMQRSLKSMAESAKAEAKRLSELAKYYENRADAIEVNVENLMTKFKIQRVETPVGVLSLRKSESVEQISLHNVPDAYLKIEAKKKFATTQEAEEARDTNEIEDFTITLDKNKVKAGIKDKKLSLISDEINTDVKHITNEEGMITGLILKEKNNLQIK